MRRLLVLAVAAWLLLAAAPAVLADSAPTDPNTEPLLPWVVGLLVTGIGLAVVGVIATRVLGRTADRGPAPEQPDAWWVCPACQSLNAEGRPACYACHATREAAPAEGDVPGPEPIVVRRAD